MTNVIPGMKYDWESQACQYAERGEPGTHLERHTIGQLGSLSVVDCLLYRDEKGSLIGIFNHYNENNPWQQPGSCNLWVHPDHQHQGIASVLLRDAWHRWDLKLEDQQWTPEGDAWINGLVEKGKIDPHITTSVNEDGWLPWHDDVERWWENDDMKGTP